jgi:DnaJ homolog subfamily C member 2
LRSHTHVSDTLAGSKPITLLPVGAAYLSHVRRTVNNQTLSQEIEEAERETTEQLLAALSGAQSRANGGLGLNGVDLGDEQEDEDLLARDPKEWKGQDHYAVLGLSHLRFKANDEEIKIARTILHVC